MLVTMHIAAWCSQTFAQGRTTSRVSRHKRYPPVRKGCVDYISGGLISDNKLLAKPEPVYPEIARAKGISGSVFVFVTTDLEGNVASAEISSGPPLLQQAALDAAKSARLPVTKMSGLPVKVGVVLKYDFDLKRGAH